MKLLVSRRNPEEVKIIPPSTNTQRKLHLSPCILGKTTASSGPRAVRKESRDLLKCSHMTC